MNPANSTHLSRLAEALFRFSAGTDQALAPHIRQAAVELAGAIAEFNEQSVTRALARARGVVELGKQIGNIAESDAAVIIGAIARSQNLSLPQPAAVAPVASVAEFAGIANEGIVVPEQKHVEEKAPEVRVTSPPAAERVQQRIPAISQSEARPVPAVQAQAEPKVAQVATAEERHARIIEAIRRNPNSRMRDLLAALPGVSERTIRYDLERLVTSGKIEREGVGGPATWYRVRAGVTTR